MLSIPQLSPCNWLLGLCFISQRTLRNILFSKSLVNGLGIMVCPSVERSSEREHFTSPGIERPFFSCHLLWSKFLQVPLALRLQSAPSYPFPAFLQAHQSTKEGEWSLPARRAVPPPF